MSEVGTPEHQTNAQTTRPRKGDLPPSKSVSNIGADGRAGASDSIDDLLKHAAPTAVVEAPPEAQVKTKAGALKDPEKPSAGKVKHRDARAESEAVKRKRGDVIDSRGMKAVEVGGKDIREFDVTKIINQTSQAGFANFRSVDGLDYAFRVRDDAGKPVKGRVLLALYAALREVGLGGNPMTVLTAFGFKQKDANGKLFFPLSEETIASMSTQFDAGRVSPSVEEPAPAEDDDGVHDDGDGFSLGAE